VSGSGEVEENREGGFFSAERLKRLKERLFEAAILGLPIALINMGVGKVSGILVPALARSLAGAPLGVVAGSSGHG
jgi:hypothetical protein